MKRRKRNAKGRFMKSGSPAHKSSHRRRRRAHAAAPVAVAAPRRRRRHARAAAAAPRRKARRRGKKHRYWGRVKGHRRHTHVPAAAPRRRHHRRRHARSNPFSGGEFALAVISGGLGFALADFADRYLASWNPTVTPAPTDRFTGGTNGTLANTLNVATLKTGSMTYRLAAAVGIPLLAGIGAYVVKNPMGRSALQGLTLGAAISGFIKIWDTYVIGGLLMPAASDQATMQASLGARLYPAQIVAAQNLAQSTVPYTAPQGLNAPPAQLPQFRPASQGLAAPVDVGPFAQPAAAPAAASMAVSRNSGIGARLAVPTPFD